MNRSIRLALMGVAALLPLPSAAHACACGCSIFDVGQGTLMPEGSASGFSAWFRVAYMDQNQNWRGSHKAPAADNQDKQLKTTFYFFGGQYVLSPKWTIMAELPIYDRSLTTTDDGTVYGPAGTIFTAHDRALGDLEMMATYTGFAADQSTGLGFGVKLPTGDWHGPKGPLGGQAIDRDSLPGTGSTDLMVSGYHVGQIGGPTGDYSYFVQAKYQAAIATQDQYRPGNELDVAVGINDDLGQIGPFSKVMPVLQLVGSHRSHDSGANADPPNTGYDRLLIDPGVAVRIKNLRLDADVGLPLWQHVHAAPGPDFDTSGQLVAGSYLRVQATYDF